MLFDLKDVTCWDPIVSKGLGNILGCSYSDTIKKNAEKILYKDCETEACDLFSAQASRENMIASVKKKSPGILMRY